MRAPSSEWAAALAVLAASAAPASAQVTLKDCHTSKVFKVGDGTAQITPCPSKTESVVPAGNGMILFACHTDGAMLCDGDGSPPHNPPPEVSCKSVTPQFQPPCTTIWQAAFTCDYSAVYLACEELIIRCDWNPTTGTATSGSCNRMPFKCPGSAAARGIVLAPDDRHLLFACKGKDGNEGIYSCELSAPGGSTPSTPCENTNARPCSGGHYEGLWIDSTGNLSVACKDKHAYCNFDVANGPTACTPADPLGPPTGRCPHKILGIVELLSGYTGVGCHDDNEFYLCGSSRSVSPLCAPDPTSNPTAAPTGPPSPSPTKSSAAPTSPPSRPPTTSPTRAPTGPPTLNPRPPTRSPSALPTTPPTLSPTWVPTTEPTPVPSPAPTASPTAAPTRPPRRPSHSPSSPPTFSPTRAPSTLPSTGPTSHPTQGPVVSPTRPPSAAPSVSPTGMPSPRPTITPSFQPSSSPTPLPNRQPTAGPSQHPAEPSRVPTPAPSMPPSRSPTRQPTAAPTTSPAASPTPPPTAAPVGAPTATPTFAPSAPPSPVPTPAPSVPPSGSRTRQPTAVPTTSPAASPTPPPTAAPVGAPTATPTFAPSAPPTGVPTKMPSPRPSQAPTIHPTLPAVGPSVTPTRTPKTPSVSPTEGPSGMPSVRNTPVPTPHPSASPTGTPSATPTTTLVPTASPATTRPSSSPQGGPSHQPSSPPSSPPRTPSVSRSAPPTAQPTARPTVDPSAAPTRRTSNQPTTGPLQQPNAAPTRSPLLPTTHPTAPPVVQPAHTLTLSPLQRPTLGPTQLPLLAPTTPTQRPVTDPSPGPTGSPSSQPAPPSVHPGGGPSEPPIFLTLPPIPPSIPTRAPRTAPTVAPQTRPTLPPNLPGVPTGAPAARAGALIGATDTATVTSTIEITLTADADPVLQAVSPSTKIAVSVFSGFASLMSMSFGAATQGSKMDRFFDYSTCPPDDHAELGFMANPTGAGKRGRGSSHQVYDTAEEKQAERKAAMLANLGIVLVFMAANAALGIAVMGGKRALGKKCSVRSGFATARFPSFSIFPALFMLQNVLEPALNLVFYDDSWGSKALAIGVIVLSSGLPLFICGITAEEYFRATYVPDPQKQYASRWAIFLWGDHMWKSDTKTFERRYALVFKDFKWKYRRFLLRELMVVAVLSVISAFVARSVWHCTIQILVAALTELMYVLSVIICRPFLAEFDHWFTVSITASQVGAIVLALFAMHKREQRMLNANAGLLMGSTLLMMIKGIFDLYSFVRDRWSAHHDKKVQRRRAKALKKVLARGAGGAAMLMALRDRPASHDEEDEEDEESEESGDSGEEDTAKARGFKTIGIEPGLAEGKHRREEKDAGASYFELEELSSRPPGRGMSSALLQQCSLRPGDSITAIPRGQSGTQPKRRRRGSSGAAASRSPRTPERSSLLSRTASGRWQAPAIPKMLSSSFSSGVAAACSLADRRSNRASPKLRAGRARLHSASRGSGLFSPTTPAQPPGPRPLGLSATFSGPPTIAAAVTSPVDEPASPAFPPAGRGQGRRRSATLAQQPPEEELDLFAATVMAPEGSGLSRGRRRSRRRGAVARGKGK
eukprot:TRINITY_DN5908_c0_g2_i8.p1 TRINITY_DN5908_c0_g2~~TRINITY_DN5908_c0_g2_i8.p1  ORF type:complete len:1600 (+),score=114.41 TRINITY_DN5908_c0_g2_i8:63-4802(+)